MSNVTVQEALKAAIAALEYTQSNSQFDYDRTLRLCKTALSEIAKCEPVAYMYHVKEEKPTSVKNKTFAALDGYMLQENETLLYREPLFYTSPQPRDWVGLSEYDKNYIRYHHPIDLVNATEAKCKQLNTKG